MALARWQATIVNDAGDVQSGATVTVRREVSGAPLASLYSDRAGSIALGNPITTGADGFVYFHAEGGAYRITAVKGAYSREWRYEGIGTAKEYDAVLIGALAQNVDAGFALTFEAETSVPPSAGAIRFDNADLSASTEAYVSAENLGGSDIVNRLMELYSAARGVKDTFLIQDPAADLQASFRIDGATAVGSPTEYVAFTISQHSGETSFTADERVNFQPNRAGADGAGVGDVIGPAGATAGHLAQFDGATGKLIADSGSSLSDLATSTVGQGKQLLAFVPAAAMTPNDTNGPELTTSERSSNKNMFKTLDFDTSTSESAQFFIGMPKKWNESTVSFIPYWTHPETITDFGVVWELSAVAISNDDATDVAFGSGQTSTDTGGTTNDLYVGPESAAITVGGTPAENDLVLFKIARLPANGSDTLAVDAQLIGVKVFYTTNAATEA